MPTSRKSPNHTLVRTIRLRRPAAQRQRWANKAMRLSHGHGNVYTWREWKGILNGILGMMLFVIAEGTLAQSTWDLTGVWEVEKRFEGRVIPGQLKLVQTGDSIEGLSTTGRSGWVGKIEGSVLNVIYKSASDSGQITLQILDDGRRLEGTWISEKGFVGTYVAIKNAAGEGI